MLFGHRTFVDLPCVLLAWLIAPTCECQSLFPEHSLGCFAVSDVLLNPLFRNDPVNVYINMFHNDDCISTCRDEAFGGQPFTYAGHSFSSGKCYCFNDLFGYHERLPDRLCHMPCTDYPNAICKSKNTFWVYTTCPHGFMVPPLCEAPCPSYCVKSSYAHCSATGGCPQGCLNGICATVHSGCTTVSGYDLLNQPPSTALIDLPAENYIFDSMVVQRAGQVESILLPGRALGKGYISFWRNVNESSEDGTDSQTYMLVGKELISLPFTGFHRIKVKSNIRLQAGDKVGVHLYGDVLTNQFNKNNYTVFHGFMEEAHDASTYSFYRYPPFDHITSDAETFEWQPGQLKVKASPVNGEKLSVSLQVILSCYCSSNCLRGQCEAGTMACTEGCLPGWQGTTCDEPCDNSTYGINCSSSCSSNCAYETCDSVLGVCTSGCKINFTGHFCDMENPDGCAQGLWGPTCSDRCSDKCAMDDTGTEGLVDLCNAFDGSCWHGCLAGFNPPDCRNICDDGFFGQDCRSLCPENCAVVVDGRTCNFLSGSCLNGCQDGFQGLYCDQTCSPGMFGRNCRSQCGFCSSGSCDVKTGLCTSCVEGYVMPLCRQLNCSVSHQGYFGLDCDQKCGHCLVKGLCNFTDGSCPLGCGEVNLLPPLCLQPCPPGHHGLNCARRCPLGKFGSNCMQSCAHCDSNAPCDAVSGVCSSGCAVGWQGPQCKTPCSPPTFGNGCNQTCGYCVTGTTCLPDSGDCPQGCMDGFYPPECTDPCRPGFFGKNCVLQCGKCRDRELCNSTTGACPADCEGSLKAPLCKECLDGLYSLKCNLRCGHCGGTGTCDMITGVCQHGCQAGYKAPLCQDHCDPGYHGNCLTPCGSCNGSHCDRTLGYCWDGCHGDFEAPLCIRCLPQVYGKNCSDRCGKCQDGTPCDESSGHCLGGCAPGFKPPKCETCDVGFFGFECRGVCGHCRNHACHYQSGKCLEGCDKGYQPPQCIFLEIHICMDGFWGEECSNRCGHCSEGTICDKKHGECADGCAAGFEPPYCDSCQFGWFSDACDQACGGCADNDTCRQLDGYCLGGCAHPYAIPPKCLVVVEPSTTTMVCRSGMYGTNCVKKCGFCAGNSACDPSSGECFGDCNPGYLPPLCQEVCSEGFYGRNCEEPCGHCDNNDPCEYTTGECLQGCADDWFGATCSLRSRLRLRQTTTSASTKTMVTSPVNLMSLLAAVMIVNDCV